MKRIIYTAITVALFGCEKTYDCTITTKTEVNPDCEYLSDSESTHTVEVKGTKADKTEFESNYPDSLCQTDILGDCDYCIIQTVNCK